MKVSAHVGPYALQVLILKKSILQKKYICVAKNFKNTQLLLIRENKEPSMQRFSFYMI